MGTLQRTIGIYPSGEDMRGRKRVLVRYSMDGWVLAQTGQDAQGVIAVGVNKGLPPKVVVEGSAKAVASQSITAGQSVAPGLDGTVIPAGPSIAIGMALESAEPGEIAQILIGARGKPDIPLPTISPLVLTAGSTSIISSYDTTSIRSAKWVLSLEEETTGKVSTREILSSHQGGNPTFTSYAILGDRLDISLNAILLNDTFSLQLNNFSSFRVAASASIITTPRAIF